MTSDTKNLECGISGMHCTMCALRLEKKLKISTGVKAASVNFETGTARIKYDPVVTNYALLTEVVEMMGYGVITDPAVFVSVRELPERSHYP
jgi:P-type Cu+ transporter